MFHVNPATGDAGRCRATQGKCPFGSTEEHYTTIEGARDSYERDMKTQYLISEVNRVSLQRKVDEFLESELGGEFNQRVTVANNGESFTATAANSFTLEGVSYKRGDVLTFDKYLNLVY